jgi:hypothetical protein
MSEDSFNYKSLKLGYLLNLVRGGVAKTLIGSTNTDSVHSRVNRNVNAKLAILLNCRAGQAFCVCKAYRRLDYVVF